ncbi:MAG: hypothetical protein WBS20_15365 [Lysobacterales bacterium]
MSRIFWVVLWATALLVNENLVQWALAVRVGKLGFMEGFSDAFQYFTLGGYAFFTAFRLIPYLILAWVVKSSIKKKRKATAGIAWGGLLGIVLMITNASWAVLHPLYTEEHASSTTAIAFLFIPFFAIVTGVLGSLAGVAVVWVMGRTGTENPAADS